MGKCLQTLTSNPTYYVKAVARFVRWVNAVSLDVTFVRFLTREDTLMYFQSTRNAKCLITDIALVRGKCTRYGCDSHCANK